MFSDRVLGTRDWDAPAPVAGWTARDVVRHLTEWLPGFLSTGAGIDLAPGPRADDDPVAAWSVHRDAVQELLEDATVRPILLTNEHIGEMPLSEAIERFYTPDVFMHTWDLARATGQDARLDPGFCAALLAGMEPMEDLIRASGQFGTRTPVAAQADAQTKLLCFIGRDPGWSPARR